LGPIYGFQWRHFGDNYRGMNESYEGGVDQVKNVIDLINNDPLSRRIILSAWNPPDLDKMALPPCHILVQFYVDVEGGYLDAQLYQRSGDMFLGVPYNIASYSMLLHIIAKLTNYKPRFLYHVIGDAHIYENHVDVVEKQLNRVPYIESADLVLSDDIKTIDNIDESMFQLNNYKSDSTLKSEMIA
jgi:thymidylate synthase